MGTLYALVAIGWSRRRRAGAIRLAEQLGPGHTVVTMFCDGGDRYRSKLWNPAFLRSRGLPARVATQRAVESRC